MTLLPQPQDYSGLWGQQVACPAVPPPPPIRHPMSPQATRILGCPELTPVRGSWLRSGGLLAAGLGLTATIACARVIAATVAVAVAPGCQQPTAVSATCRQVWRVTGCSGGRDEGQQKKARPGMRDNK